MAMIRAMTETAMRVSMSVKADKVFLGGFKSMWRVMVFFCFYFVGLSRFLLAFLSNRPIKNFVRLQSSVYFFSPSRGFRRSQCGLSPSFQWGGFTLVEVLIVLFILGVFLLFAVPSATSIVKQSREIRCESRLEMINRAKSSYIVDNLAGQIKFTHMDLDELPLAAPPDDPFVPTKEGRKAVFRMYFMEPFPFSCPAAPLEIPNASKDYQDVYHLYKKASCPYCGGGGGGAAP
jgi:prepilin-type N-terminal cleavage/methylation domain-containing protein